MKFTSLFRFKRIRFLWVKYRYFLMRKNIRFKENGSSSIGEDTVRHNLSAFNSDAAFGCGERMGLLIYPAIAYNSFYNIDKRKQRVLIVGCRTEDDIYWMRAYGFTNTYGFDLFSYSKNILVGDIHKSNFEDASFDIVILGWMISYTKDPTLVFKECNRILRPHGLFGVGLEHNPNQKDSTIVAPRVNTLNTASDIIGLMDSTMKHDILFKYDHCNQNHGDFSVAVVTIRK